MLKIALFFRFWLQKSVFSYAKEDTSHEKIYSGKDPKGDELGRGRGCEAVGMDKRCTHRIDVDKPVCAPGIWDRVGEVFPCVRNHLFRPRNTCHKEEDKRGGDQEHQARFAVADEDRNAHAKENNR